MGKRLGRLGDWTWEKTRAEGVQESAGKQLVMVYIGRQQVTVAQWVELRPLFEVC